MPIQFDYDDQSLSPESSADAQEDEVSPVDSSRPTSQSSHLPPVTSPAEPHAVENLDTVEPPQAFSADAREDEMPPVRSSHTISQSSHLPPVTSPAKPHAVENLNTVESPPNRSIFTRWLQRKSNRGGTSHEHGRHSGELREPADPRSPSHLPAGVNATNKGPSWMAAGQLTPRVAARSGGRQKNKSSAKAAVPKHPNRDISRGGQGSAGANEGSPAQETIDPSQPSAAGVHLSQGSNYTTLSITFPTWMLCFRSGTHDEVH